MKIKPMLATLGKESDIDEADERWAFEMKWDGIRAVATVSKGSVKLETRNGNDVTGSYPDLAELAGQTSGDCVLDGEIVALDARGRPDFGRLQGRMGLTKKADVDRAVREIAVNYMVFDILELGGKSLLKKTYDERRELLTETLHSKGRVHVPPAFDGDLDAALASSRQLDLEGVMAKKRDSTYLAGGRSRAWIKIKHHRTQEVVIGGWRPGNGRRAGSLGSLLLGIPSADGLHYVGRVGTGFGDRALTQLAAKLSPLERATTAFIDVPAADASDARWVTPSIVGEVEFAEWTSGERLRQPTWRGLRPDKAAADVTRE
jgi:bifunctional non-homologous end joining protein LigD